MPFDPDPPAVSDLRAAVDGADLLILWRSTRPAGTAFQVYCDSRFAGWTTAHDFTLPLPDRRVRIVVGAVGSGEEEDDFSGDLPAVPGGGDRAKLTWLGGTYLDPSGNDDVNGFHVYSGTAPGGAVSYATPIDTIPLYVGRVLDGFGEGGFGRGGFGRSATSYEWISGPLAPGTWNFSVRSFDYAGNETDMAVGSVVIAGPPGPPGLDANGNRLTYTYLSPNVTLHWLPPS
jgi:hypothetical protein